LTPQTVARFLARFGSVAVLHSGLTAAQRHAQWRRIREGKARIVIGARSAIFAPVQKLGLIIVDEEHESSYKQDQLPRYHARDVAIRRAQMRGVPVVLGSATPSLESYRNAVRAKEEAASGAQASQSVFHLVRMPERVPGMKLPDVEIVDLQEERRQRRGIHLLSQRMEAELKRIVCGPSGDGAAQALLLLNRRGYANYIACPDHRCGWMMRCEYCDVTMVYHKDGRLPTGGLVRCHHCQAEQLLPSVCEVCGKKVTVFGLGTQRVAEELERKFPGIKAIRMDADTMRSARDYRETLDRFRRGEAHVLLGTQMIAKGLDFPSVRLVGVISGDTALHLPDFRAAERTFQLISQVAGRAGRSSEVGRVIVQSFSPEDPAIVLASKHDYEGFAARELAFRQEVGLPPATRMVRIVIRDPDPYGCIQRARELAEHLTRFDQQLGTQIRITGPMPCPIARIAGFHRQEIKLVAPSAGPLQRLLTAARNIRLLTSDARTAVDVDPVSLL
ncbi:MAG: replication restart helicase PriA, partial [Phycisphaeraceae bacterium]